MATTSPDNLWTPDSGDDYALTVDLAAFADTVQDALTAIRNGAQRLIGLDSVRTALTAPALKEGLEFYSTDTNIQWTYDGSAWFVSFARIRGTVNRSVTATTFPASYTNVGATTFWTPDVAVGISAYANCWKVALAGRYNIAYEIRASGAFLSGVAINYSGTSPNLFGTSSPQPVQGVAATTVSFTKKLAANDEIRPYLLAASGTPSWSTGVGFFSVEWVGND